VAAPALAAEVEARLGRPIFRDPADAEISVEGRAEPGTAPTRWRAVLKITDRGGNVLGERVVASNAEACDELGHVVAVTLALMIDPVTEPPPAAEVPEEPEPPRWRFEAVAAVDGGHGLVPGVTIGGTAVVLVTPPRFLPVYVTGELVPFGQDASGEVDVARVTGGLGICPLAVAGVLRGCVGVDAGARVALRGGETLDAPEHVVAQGRVSLRAAIPVWGPLRVGLGVHGIVPVRRDSLASDGDVLWTAPPVAAMGEVGLGVDF
jgi:hypothetical protein